MRLLVCGGRDYQDRAAVFNVLDRLHESRGIELVIHGAEAGADRLAGEWAQLRSIPEQRFPADWDKHRKAAGPIRNQQMLDEGKPDGVVAFPGGVGTAGMIRKAEAAGVRVWEPVAPPAQLGTG